ncbi:aminotransferase class III-fold pyridoxal phosphate-dependent enzyme [Bacteroidetes bacterium endosymbiont of Geopemphigus sp.]|uniref:aminotransferase class III-fold pyridoxal phosphate-dependent enzyme n=1 Tax=Bacteroidetes bacterium endosymbiont of Geopemphigus sp. TaxID=2047937 RepID=UPI002AD38F2B|nr:aminotransferase class III-fold pyridoxal phosphate-dependent enzyme [Bacteroidetes bacterium endosymbiont of Geopemphigus sp.]
MHELESFFAFEHCENALPDVLVMGKGMGGGMPIDTFIVFERIMSCLSHNPTLGYITTFGDHRVIAKSTLATFLDELMEWRLMQNISEKEKLFQELLVHKEIRFIQGRGLMLACELKRIRIENNPGFPCKRIDCFLAAFLRRFANLSSFKPYLRRSIQMMLYSA